MLSYSFSKREKVLLVVLAIVLVGIVWFVFVFQRTASEASAIDSQITEVQSEIAVKTAQLTQTDTMRQIVEERKAAGDEPTVMPDYDNLTALMAELDRVLGAAGTYTISFDDLESPTAVGYVLRGVQISFNCASFGEAKSIAESLANGPYACSVDELDMNASSSSSGGVSAAVHVVYYERASQGHGE